MWSSIFNTSPIAYEIGVQYSHRNFSDDADSDADIYGAMANIGFENTGINVGIAYNTANDNYVTNGFGGGTSSIQSQNT